MAIDLPPVLQTNECLDASYYSFQNGIVSSGDENLVLLYKSLHDEIGTRIFIFKSKKDGKILITFEGTGIENKIYEKNSNKMNEITKMGLTPPSYRYALSFTIDYIKKNNVNRDDIILTGYSAGAAQAEFVSNETMLPGIVFAGTGIPGKIHKADNFWNFVGKLDPVASFSSDTDYIFNTVNLKHYGNVIYLGNPYVTYGTFGNIVYSLISKKGEYLFYHFQPVYMNEVREYYGKYNKK